MTTELKELKDIILAMDEMLAHWFNGTLPDFVEWETPLDSIEWETSSVYEIADHCRNRALDILKKLEKGIDK